jgi:hypothetical protein
MDDAAAQPVHDIRQRKESKPLASREGAEDSGATPAFALARQRSRFPAPQKRRIGRPKSPPQMMTARRSIRDRDKHQKEGLVFKSAHTLLLTVSVTKVTSYLSGALKKHPGRDAQATLRE